MTATLSPAAKKALSMIHHRNAQKAKREEKRTLRQEYEDQGIDTIMVWHCDGSPEILSQEKIQIPAPTEDDIDLAKLQGRFIEKPEYAGTIRFYTGEKVTYRPYRFLATDMSTNFGGIQMSDKMGDVSARFRYAGTKAMKSWQIKKDVDPTRPANEQKQFMRNCLDEREQNWGGGRDENPQGVYRARHLDETRNERNLTEWEIELARVRAG